MNEKKNKFDYVKENKKKTTIIIIIVYRKYLKLYLTYNKYIWRFGDFP